MSRPWSVRCLMGNEPNSPGERPAPPGAFIPADQTPPAAAQEIALPKATTATKPAAKTAAKTPQHHDSFREFIETIVFVVVLVLILKTFLAEAFVIPTGSMATTLLGYHSEVTCEECGYRFLVNKSKEADPAEAHHQVVTGCTCPNCSFHNDLRKKVPGGLP